MDRPNPAKHTCEGSIEVPIPGLSTRQAYAAAVTSADWQAFLDAFTDPDPEFEWMVLEARGELERLGGRR